MKPLLYLYSRTIWNGVKRAFSSPRRLIGILVFVLYNLWWLPRLAFGGSNAEAFSQMPKFQLPPMAVIDALVFGLFCALTVVLGMNAFGLKGGFKPADVDVLFPTPVSPRLVLVFRLLRDYAVTLVVPLFFLVILWRPANSGWTSLVSGLPNPASAGYVVRAGWLAYLLLTSAWITIGYAVGLFLNRVDARYERIRRAWGWACGVLIVAVGVSIYLRVLWGGDFAHAVRLASAPDLRTVFFLATGATALTMAPLKGSVALALAGAGGLLAATAAGLALALRQAPYMYEQAAVIGAALNARIRLRRRGDLYGAVAEQARQGKVRKQGTGRLGRARAIGPLALVWKEALLLRRTSVVMALVFALVSVAGSVMASLMPRSGEIGAFPGVFALLIQAMLLFSMSSGSAQAGYLENLRRIDLLKPLPFRSEVIVGFEVLGKSLVGAVAVLIGMAALAVMAPTQWPFALAGALMLPPMAVSISSLMMLLTLLLPDIDDPTQRGFRGLVSLLGVVVFAGPPVGLFAVCLLLRVHPALAAIPSAMVLLGVAALGVLASARLYTDFNPAE